MPRSRKPTSDYDVGYGRPPAHTRFKPGQSGNPRGRAKGASDLRTVMVDVFKKQLSQTVNVVEDGKPRKVTKFDLMMISNVNKAAKGDARALREIVALAHRLGLLEGAPVATVTEEAQPFSDEDQAIIDRMFARHRSKIAAEQPGPALTQDPSVEEAE
ncbi:DUF5681 domain-containing protein [Methylobacterium trifolii]|uniref:DUF5681 domain-containing protein n=1 Tax=Methylobacterium trifolii TaxID=1003092 RepID=A0ABQ4U2B1_9HYPH|nr:DUF5681 domain-containing protein [Methylobacterium trifolii]GJE61113.1 hypothetical protein MPOCJGCO_3234 [Methylobacterium trifolii]